MWSLEPKLSGQHTLTGLLNFFPNDYAVWVMAKVPSTSPGKKKKNLNTLLDVHLEM